MARRAADPAVAATLTAETLASAVRRLIGDGDAARARFGIAVSGGPDSMALLLLAQDAFAGRIAAATVDHGLRPEAADEAAMVAAACAARGIPHAILRPGEPISGSVQAAARAVRYALLDDWRRAAGLDWLMTAHHADDQLETLVMRLNRASGLAGLSGIRAVQGHVLRPLLGVRRDALVALLAACGVVAVDDPSNRDTRFDRARVRAELAGQTLIDAAAAAASARHLAQEEEALAWVVARLAEERIAIDGDARRIDTRGLPAALVRRLLIVALAQGGEAEPRGETVERAMADIAGGTSAMIGNSLIASDGAIWTIRPAPPRRMSR